MFSRFGLAVGSISRHWGRFQQPTAAAATSAFPYYIGGSLFNNVTDFQFREFVKITKRKAKRLARRRRRAWMEKMGIPIPKPPRYIDPTTPVINAVPREEQRRRILERRKNEHLVVPPKKTIHAELDGSEIPPLLLPFQESIVETEASLKIINPKVAKVLSLTNGNQRRAVQFQKAAGMKLFQLRPADTGSTPVQVIALTARIQQKETHLVMHPKDHSSKRMVQILKARRRKLLDYLERKDFLAYSKVVTTLGLR